MNNTKQYEDLNVHVVINKRLKHSYIRVKIDKSIEVKTPISSTLFVEKFLKEKRSWIDKQLQKIELLEFREQEQFDLAYIKSRVEYFAERMQLHYNILRFRKMKRRWGSCNTLGNITLNKELMKLDANMIDYVVVHELAHLVHMNHSPEFHAFVESYLPCAKKAKKSLQSIRITA